MTVRMSKAWEPVAIVQDRLSGNLGVFELANGEQEVMLIGFAGGQSRYGLKGEVANALAAHPAAAFARYEVTTAYHTRYRELLMAHIADHGRLPAYNEPITLGRLSPA